MRLFKFVFVPLLQLMLFQSELNAQEVLEAKVMSVTGSTLFTLSMAKKQSIDMEGLTWVDDGVPWRDVVGKVIRFQPIVGKGTDFFQNRYGDLKGKILMEPFGWMQKYWVATGRAVVSGAGPYPHGMQQALLKAEGDARKLKVGMWADWAIIPATDMSAFSGRRGFQIVEGQVKEVRKIRGVSYVNFGQNWKNDFTAAITSKNRSNFKRVDWKLSELAGKRIRIRGRIRSYNGPYMELIFPEQIEILE